MLAPPAHDLGRADIDHGRALLFRQFGKVRQARRVETCAWAKAAAKNGKQQPSRVSWMVHLRNARND